MVDFAALPPEVNSARMYAGSGAGPLLAAAAGWDGVASELGSAASAYQSVVSDLTGGEWRGPSSSAMAAAAAPYVAWMNATASAAKQSAGQARSAAAAYEQAFAAMVPPPVITANRSTLASLVATNIVSQNTAAIAANEATYAEMWAQDAAAMYGYAGASAAATQLTAYSPAPETTNPAGSVAQAAATSQASSTNGLSQAISQVPTALQAMATPAATDPFASIEDFLSDPLIQAAGTLIGTLGNYYGYAFSAVGFVGCLPGFFIGPLLSLALPEAGALPAAFAATASDVSGGALGAGLADSYVSGVGGGVSAGLGEAASVGGLSVPPTWGSPASTPAVRLAASEMPLAGLSGAPESAPVAPSGLMGGVPPMGGVVNAPREGQSRLRAGHRAKVIPAIAAAPGAHPDTPQKWSQPSIASAHSDAALSDQEQAELDELREQLSELAMERDAAARLIKEAIR